VRQQAIRKKSALDRQGKLKREEKGGLVHTTQRSIRFLGMYLGSGKCHDNSLFLKIPGLLNFEKVC
jgi:hypothetical protein